ncbi:MAG: hypothetical protein EZS28_013269 [Streblomastix strix]|uniref:Uncharacterized protein n=1 Tax=Streblomastix strix TaxID=222440 RepID=A0A5J4W987_9EUKA|nr:MAG: hypothetical protein EZS28_013269 [Streblomastix strix]
MQQEHLSFNDLNEADQNILLQWKDHIRRAEHQTSQLESQIENLSPNEATFHIDFKENFNIGMNRDQKSQSFFTKAPVTCLTAVVHKGKPRHLIQKKVITLLSPILTHNCSFTLLAVQKMFESEFMKDIDQVHWWSDGGPHFRNKQLIWALLNEEDILIPGTNFEVNFTVPYHGKGAPDGIFGMYITGLRNNMPKEGINSIEALQRELKLLTEHQALVYNDPERDHEILIFNVDRFNEEEDQLVINDFRKFLNFVQGDNEILAKPLTGIADAGERSFQMKSTVKQVKRTPKRSTALIKDE